MNRQLRSTMLAVLLSLVLLVPAITGSAQAAQPGRGQPGPAVGLPESWQGIPGGSTGWWAAAQENIRQSEYQVTRQDQAVLADVGAAYQAPNRAHNLRTYFSPQGIRVIPRVLAGETPPWQWGVALSGYGEAGAVQPVPAASLHVEGNRVEYRRGALTEWYVNDARGLVQGFLLSAPRAAGSASQSSLVLESSLGGDLTARLSADGQAIDLTTPGGGRALRYGGLAAYDAAGRALPARLDLAAGVLRITLGVAGAAYPITVGSTITGLATDPAWTAEGDQDDALYGYSVGTAGDVNGDGYSDVIVGAPSYDTGQTAAGRAYVYHGSVEGLAADPAWTAESDQESAGLGEAVGTAGDVNGDGYSDVIVSAPSYDNDQVDEGQVYVFYGSAEGLAADPAWTAESDHYGCGFGSSAGTAGDVNGDGYSDVIVGAPEYDNDQTDEGQAFVYYGSADGLGADPDWTAESDQDDALFGESVGTAGDVNGDGYSDVIVGADYYDNDQEDEGRAYVYHGGAAGLAAEPAWTAESDQAYAQFGISVGTAGDVNGDGYSDIIVGAFYYNGGQNREGQAYVYHGSAIGLAADPAWTAEGNQTSALFGYAVRTAGDVNGDGYGDVIIGAYTYDNGQENEGRVYVYHGSPAGLATDPSWTAESNQDSALLGWSVGTAGDVNGDGYSDVIAGAVWYSNGQSAEGRAYVYYGNGGDGLDVLPRQMRADGSAPIAYLGMSDSRTAFQLRLTGRMPLGRDDVRLQWQVAPLGTPITATDVISGVSGWTDVLTTGVVISQDVAGLTLSTPYHWRVRLLYRPGNALGQPASRWLHIPWAGWNETDVRTNGNEPPIADAGPDQAVNRLALVTLDGRASADPGGDLPLTYLWMQAGGPPVTFTPGLSVTTFTAPGDPAVLTFTLAVTDSLGLPDPTPDVVVITVQPYHIYLPLVAR